MALVLGPFELRVTFVDEAGNDTTRSYKMVDTIVTPAAAETAAAALIADLAASTTATITRYSVATVYTEDATFLGTAGSEVENNAQLTLKVDNPDPSKTWTTTIPSPVIGMFVGTSGPNKNIVDGADTVVVNFIDNFQTTGGNFTVSDGETVDDTTPFVKGKRVHKASSSG